MSNISQRAQILIGTPSPLVDAHFEAEADPYHPQNNPKGAINLGTAENHLMDQESLARVTQPFALNKHYLHYAEFRGIHSLRKRIALFLEQVSFIKEVSPNNIVIGNGVSSLLESLAYTLFDEGDAVLIPSPCYSGYHDDFSARFGVKIITAPMSLDNDFALDMDIIKRRYKEAVADGEQIKALLINSPNNPLGHVYSEKVLTEAVKFAQENDLQIISDEIYTHSVFEGSRAGSLLEIGKEYRHSIHMLYGMAKDFGLSGFKFGFVYSENSKLIQAMSANAYFYNVSTYTQAVVEQLFTDIASTRQFLKLYKQRLGKAYQHFQACNQATLDAPYIPAQGGHFVFINLGAFLSENTFEAEMLLFENIWESGRVNITPGQFFACPTPGWFRLCFANEAVLVSEAFFRLKKLLIKGALSK
ncbi:aminotransferase class I/II-fold pyridoxal phosphate-dependent enzyme [Pseudomonadota bacterium]